MVCAPSFPAARAAHASLQPVLRFVPLPDDTSSPCFLAKALPDTHYLSSVLDFTNGYAASRRVAWLAYGPSVSH